MDDAAARNIVQMAATNYPELLQSMRPILFHREDMEEAINQVMDTASLVPPAAASSILQTAYNLDIRDGLPALTKPVLLLHSRHDQVADPRWAEYAAARLPNAHMAWLENSGRYPMLEEPERVSEELDKYSRE